MRNAETLIAQTRLSLDIRDRITRRISPVYPAQREAWSEPHALALEFEDFGKEGLRNFLEIYPQT